MTDDNQVKPAETGFVLEDLLALALRGANIEWLVVDLDDGRRIRLESLDGDITMWSMTDGRRMMLMTCRVNDDGSAGETLSIEWLP